MIFVNVDVPMERWPVTNWLLIAATCLISFAVWGDAASTGRGRSGLPPALRQVIQMPDAHGDDALIGALQPNHFSMKQLVTYQFVHGDPIHLIGNMLFLFCFGNAINAKLGHLPFLALYLGLGIFSGLGWLLLGSGAPLIGSSGAIAGINGVFLVLYPLNEAAIHTPRTYMFSNDVWRMPAWLFIVGYMLFDLWGTLVTPYGGVGYVCHVAGEIAGVMVASALVLSGWVTSQRGERNLMEIFGWVSEDSLSQHRGPTRRNPRVID
ncbi:MAG: rhomboid family intramembrane serine protease [Gemmataceae bacterium]